MKIPKEIKGKNKVRDAMIINMFCEGYRPEEIKEIRRLPLTTRRIEQIIYNNREFVKINKEFEEVKQINRIVSRVKKAKHSKKDVLDWETLLHNKISPKRVEHSGSITTRERIIIIRPENANQTENISR